MGFCGRETQTPARANRPMSKPSPSASSQAQELFAEGLKKIPQTTAEAETAKVTAEAFVHLAEAEKIREEMRDAATMRTQVQRWVQFAVGVVGLTGTIAGAFGTFFFMQEMEEKRAELEQQEKIVADQKKQLVNLDRLEADAKKSIEVSERLKKALTTENEVAEAELKQKAESLKTAEVELARKKADIEASDQDIKDKRAIADSLREQNDKFRDAIARLNEKTKGEIEKQLGTDSALVASVTSRPPTANPPTAGADTGSFVPRVERLFASDAKTRGNAYNDLTTSKDRFDPRLGQALLQVGRAKLDEYKSISPQTQVQAERDRLATLRRGLENVVVTIRDISRQVTKREGARQEFLRLADDLIKLEGGVSEEAQSLRDWLNKVN